MSDAAGPILAAADAVARLHTPQPTTLGVLACWHCSMLHGGVVVPWPCPTWQAADDAAGVYLEGSQR